MSAWSAAKHRSDLQRSARPSKHHASTPPSTDGTCSFSCAGACARGRCLTTVVSTRKQPAGIALGGADVFWLERDSDAWSYVVARAPLTGGMSTTLTSRPGSPSEFQGIAVDETSVYWAEQGPDSGAILKMPRAGGPAVTLASGLRAPRSLALDGMNVYFTHEIATAPAGALLSVSTNGGSPSALAAELHEHTDVAVDAGYVYLLAHDAQGASIKKLPVAGGAPSTLATGLRLPRSIAVDTSHVYWTDVNTVMRAPLAGGAGATLLASAQSLDFVATDGALVYWLSGGAEGTVMSVPVGGGTSSALLAQQRGPLRDLVVNDRGIFWTSSDACNGMIMRLAAE